MNTKALLAIVTLAAAASTGARAESADPSTQYALQIEGSRTRAEVQAEAARVAATRSQEPNGSRVIAPVKSSVDTATVRAQAAEAVRLGQTSAGEVGRM